MSDVLRRLALRVLPGAGDTVRPRLRSRFESRSGPSDTLDAGLATARPDASPTAAATSPPLFGEAAPRTATLAPFTAPVAAPPEAKPVATGRIAAPRTPDLLSPSFVPVAPEPLPNREGSGAAAAAAPGSAGPAAGPPTLPAQPHGAAGHQLEPRPSHLLFPEMRQPEGPDALVAGETPSRGGGLPPDIRISIDRIDVRAGGEPRLTPPRPRARSRPTLMSLEDYLGKGRSRP